MLVQTQVRDVTSRHPVRRSARRLAAGRADVVGTRRSASEMLDATKVAASIAKTTPDPVVATSTPASAGPTTTAMLRDRLSRALACWSRAALTASGTSPVDAGEKNASAAP